MRELLIKYVLQPIADLCVFGVKISPTLHQSRQWFNHGMTLNNYLTIFHDIYLD
jgi:hypothetical protein